MAERKRTKTTRKTEEKPVYTARKTTNRNWYDYFALTESYTSLLLGAVVVVIATILLVAFFRNRDIAEIATDQPQISATQLTPTQNNNQYTVQAGDDLWKIAEKTYNDGYKWVEIAKANNLTDPGNVSVGMKLTLPNLTEEKEATDKSAVVAVTDAPTQMESTEAAELTPTQAPTANQDASDTIQSEKYTVVAGDSLWDIARRAYNDPYKWVEIARANNLTNPDLIYPDTQLTLPR